MILIFPEEEELEWQFSPKVAPHLLQVTRTWCCTDVCSTLGAGPQYVASPETACRQLSLFLSCVGGGEVASHPLLSLCFELGKAELAVLIGVYLGADREG